MTTSLPPVSGNISIPYLRVEVVNGPSYLTDSGYDEIRNMLNFDQKYCKSIPDADETVFVSKMRSVAAFLAVAGVCLYSFLFSSAVPKFLTKFNSTG